MPFDKKKFDAALFDQETKWTLGNESYPDKPVGDTVMIAKMLHGKYRPMTV